MESVPGGRYDGNLGDIMQNERQIDRFLDVIFEFLYRRTDFYRLMKHENDSMGLPPGVARKHVMQAYMKYEHLAHGTENPATAKNEKKPAATDPSIDAPVAVESVVEVTTTTEVTDLPGSPSSSTSQPTERSCPTASSTSPAAGAGSSPRLNPDTGEVIADTACSSSRQKSHDTPPDTSLDTPAQRHNLNAADTYNGALRDNYAWSQTLKDIDLKVFVPPTVTKAKQLMVDIKNESIKVTLKGCPSDGQGGKVLVEGKLKEGIRGEETIWSLDPGNCVQINLEKRREVWWKGVLEDEPEIDQKAIDNTQYVHEMDEQSQTDYQRVMYDMERKRQGLPSSKEEETHNILRKAWNAEGSPFKGSEFDPSKINISAS
ncbi:nudC domain-containing protein 3-like [Lytechinus variegatus]|uniref:nudC domain-containing protein 3-like n=1 Tax=Lytechinus variegatus TaxID=7654 RepID=UPI001BB1E375|nr:nudC domain-containing protein 3-like [Lytechinus variegatus]XP_041474654.1 nudC domain-containing protein 3-like [Lytechinus variegatus]XP_041474655.1 nudC domain-containing protein 3-like [Lytechinus variegatus]XP_041474656.1 nudC domain-containing protein 3-like [Lytechinus variegatus]